MTTPTMQERGRDAAKVYCERIGFTFDAEFAFSSDTTFTCRDGEQLVLVHVLTRSTRGTTSPHRVPKHIRQTAKAAGARLDQVTLLVIGEDRALLRHHRDVQEA